MKNNLNVERGSDIHIRFLSLSFSLTVIYTVNVGTLYVYQTRMGIDPNGHHPNGHRKEFKEWWLAAARRVGTCITPREGKNVFTGEISHIYPSGREELAPIFASFEVIERTIDKYGEYLLIPDIEVNTFWTNLSDAAETVIRLYHNHGTREQYHSELKTDLGIERLASGKFKTNALLLQVAMLLFNCLRIIGQSSLKMTKLLPRKLKVMRRRLKSVMQDLIYIACKRVRHAGSIILKIGNSNPWFEVFRQLHIKFA